ncbi:MAG: hypothetical protein FWF85_00585 [Clostridiales bacterium]|nr:hypothetical protein [Clostridiales bacterium]
MDNNGIRSSGWTSKNLPGQGKASNKSFFILAFPCESRGKHPSSLGVDINKIKNSCGIDFENSHPSIKGSGEF